MFPYYVFSTPFDEDSEDESNIEENIALDSNEITTLKTETPSTAFSTTPFQTQFGFNHSQFLVKIETLNLNYFRSAFPTLGYT